MMQALVTVESGMLQASARPERARGHPQGWPCSGGMAIRPDHREAAPSSGAGIMPTAVTRCYHNRVLEKHNRAARPVMPGRAGGGSALVSLASMLASPALGLTWPLNAPGVDPQVPQLNRAACFSLAGAPFGMRPITALASRLNPSTYPSTHRLAMRATDHTRCLRTPLAASFG